jgi:hypothetical protein
MEDSMKRLWILAGLVVSAVLVSCSGNNEVSDAEMLRAQAELGPYKSRLVSALTMAVAESPVKAIDVCSVKAPEIAASLGSDRVRMGRTSHRLRNPNNAPEAWVEPLLADYVAHPDHRDPRAVRLDDGAIGFVEPIYVKPLCLVCHGPSIPPEVGERIAALYPDDQATGFNVGDFRGLFWVTMSPAGNE